MVRVQTKTFRDILVVGVMEHQYHEFGESENSSVHGDRIFTAQPVFKGMKRIVAFVLYGFLVLLLLILLMVTGIRFSQLNKEITDVKLHLERISPRGQMLLPGSGEATVQEVYFKRLTPAKGSCQEGWVSFETGCYLLSNTAVSWSTAEEQCRAHGAHLLVLNNVEELDYISKVVELRYSYWIGLVEREHEGHWSWVDGTDFHSTPTFWDEGQPDNWDYRVNGEDCGQLHSSDRRKRKLWNDADCSLGFQYICEKRA